MKNYSLKMDTKIGEGCEKILGWKVGAKKFSQKMGGNNWIGENDLIVRKKVEKSKN